MARALAHRTLRVAAAVAFLVRSCCCSPRPHQKVRRALEQSPALRHVPAPVLEQLADEAGKPMSLASGQPISALASRTPCASLWLVCRGQVTPGCSLPRKGQLSWGGCC